MSNLPSSGPAKAARPLPANLCGGSGTVPMVSMTGDGYEYSACLGCQACARIDTEAAPTGHLRRDPFAGLPASSDDLFGAA